MGLFAKLFGLSITCPACKSPGAKDTFGGIKCPYEKCINFAPDLLVKSSTDNPDELNDDDDDEPVFRESKRDFSKIPPVNFAQPVEIEYVNANNHRKKFIGDAGSMYIEKKFLRVCVQPTGQAITLKLDKIVNRSAVEQYIKK